MLELKYKFRTYMAITWCYYLLFGTFLGALVWCLFYHTVDGSLKTCLLSFGINIAVCFIVMIIKGLAHRGSYISVKDGALDYQFVKYNRKILLRKKTDTNTIVRKVCHYHVDNVKKMIITGNGFVVYGDITLNMEKVMRNKTEHKEALMKKMRIPYHYANIEKLAMCFS